MFSSLSTGATAPSSRGVALLGHSGVHGGSVHNPVQAASEIVAKLHNKDGSIAVPGFYDDPTASADVVATHQSLKGELDRLYQEWETLERKPAKSRSA